MILSHQQIEEIGAAVTQDFNEFYFYDSTVQRSIFVRATPIEQLAREYLGLSIGFARLSMDGSICGLTCYADTEFTFEELGVIHTVSLKRNQVLLDSSFIEIGNVKKLYGKCRFTLAHECAHQILFQLECEESRQRYRQTYSERKPYSLRDLKTREDWNEWQANALGAALLMPQEEVDRAMWFFAQCRTLISYGGRFSYADKLALSLLCQTLGVSKSAAVIRLRQLGYLEEHPYTEFSDPLEVWA